MRWIDRYNQLAARMDAIDRAMRQVDRAMAAADALDTAAIAAQLRALAGTPDARLYGLTDAELHECADAFEAR